MNSIIRRCSMRNIIITVILAVFSSFSLYGCSLLEKNDQSNSENNEKNSKLNKYEKENYVSIQEYTGEGFTLRNANKKIDDIVQESREDIVTAVELFFENQYNTQIKVHNIVSAIDGASVFVESIGEPHFYTFAIVPIDVKNNIIHISNVRSEEGQVENAIQGGLYAMAYEKDFKNLDNILENIAEEHPVTGTPFKVIERVKGNGYTTPYYFISTLGDVFDDLFEQYMENPNMTKKELNNYFTENEFDPDTLSFGIEFYMEDQKQKPNEEVYDAIFKTIEEAPNIPKGEYYVFLNDNFIDRIRGIGKKENTIEKTVPNGIIKK